MKIQSLRSISALILAGCLFPVHAKAPSSPPTTINTGSSEGCGNPLPTATPECEPCKKSAADMLYLLNPKLISYEIA